MRSDLHLLADVRRVAAQALTFVTPDTVPHRAFTEILAIIDGRGQQPRWSLDRRLQHARAMRAHAEGREAMRTGGRS